jgi:hypothetical protein
MQRYALLLASFFILLCIQSCGITYKVRNTNNELREILYFPCGNVAVEMIGRGNSKFKVESQINATIPIIYYQDSLKVYYNGQRQKLIMKKKPEEGSQDFAKIEGSHLLEYHFEIKNGVFDGDTLTIFAPQLVKCEKDFITLDSINYAFTNRLRIYGVNAL